MLAVYWQRNGEADSEMLDTEAQLARLKQRVAAINRKYADTKRPPAPVLHSSVAHTEDKPARWFIEEWAQGQVVGDGFGEHFESERLFPGHRPHGSADVGALAEMSHDLLDVLSEGQITNCPPDRWAFLDTETTGLAGGSGTYAFLIGVGRITNEGFRIRQFFMREYAEERSVLSALHEHLREFDVLVTYNGRSYDQPLLETRYRMTRLKPPFARLTHLDLLYGARRLWKLRLDGCRLMQLENQILGVCREGDLPGEMIPYVYFEYLRSREAQRLVPIFHHNAIDILTLACLTAIVPAAFRDTGRDSLERLGLRRGEELLGIARWLISAGEDEKGLELLKRAIDSGLPDCHLFPALWKVGLLEKKLDRPHAALEVFSELAGCRNEFRVPALEELAKYYEHEERNFAIALEFTHQALLFGETAELLNRKARLERRLHKPRTKRLL